MAASTFFKLGASQPAFSVETPTRAFEPTRPYPQNPSAIVYRVRFMQLRAFYARPAANTPHPNLPQVYFADDVDFQDRQAGLIEWTRIYLTLPDSWSDYESYPYAYPGYYATTNVPGRPPIVRTTTARLLQDYALVGPLTNYVNNVANGDDIFQSSWGALNMGKTANATEIPVCAGAYNYATKLTPPDGTSGPHYVTTNSNCTIGPMSATVFLKSNGLNAELKLTDGGAGNASVSVDLSTGLVFSNSTENYTIAAIGEGWWRVGVSTNRANTNAGMFIYAIDSNGSNAFQGDGVKSVFAWRGQMSPTFTLPHATIPPTSSTGVNANYPFTTPADVPATIASQFAYGIVISTGPSFGQSIGFLSDTVVSNTNVNQVSASIPSLTNYKANVTADNSNSNSFSIEATDSTIGLYQGSIWVRQRRLVKAR